MPLKFSKSTDTEHTIKLDSTLIYAVWRTGFARAGHPAGFEVATSFVGKGAKIKIKGESENGESLGKVDGKISNNKFIGELDIPEDIELGDMVYFTVDISQVGLSGESNRIPAGPPVDVTNLKWSEKEARRGDILKLTADVSGCENGSEARIIILEYDEDGIHDKIVEIPADVTDNKLEIQWEYEYHEDTDEIPTDEELEKYGKSYNPPEYFFVVEIDGQKFGEEQESGLLLFKDFIEIELLDNDGNPIANADYILTLQGGEERKGTLDDKGMAKEENVPPGSVSIEFPDIEDDIDFDEDEG